MGNTFPSEKRHNWRVYSPAFLLRRDPLSPLKLRGLAKSKMPASRGKNGGHSPLESVTHVMRLSQPRVLPRIALQTGVDSRRGVYWQCRRSVTFVMLLFPAFIGSLLVIVFSAIKSTDVYNEALDRAKADPAVIEALGSPIKDGFLVSGNANVNGASGESNLAIPIPGPKSKGTIYVSANKSLGQWNYSGLIVEVRQTHQRIDLLQKSVPANSR